MRVEMLAGWTQKIVKGQEFEEKDGQTVAIETWTLVLTERGTNNQIRYAMRKDTRDELMKQLTAGIVLADGLPKPGS